ncbi:EcoAI/FtnUII family type I restriction enzme subunit R [Pectinatus frisingensis]|uniref:EcoAI/FtnUII family type I restriction enzme subunit R n=1 Tax=Pectinatus frisingensis TaxID=865 RepID=UPI0018C64928|nr:DEAD/DEAH box helicase family protein [Pectinatus frisingensis]
MEYKNSKLTEEDVKLRFITPAIEQAKWEKLQIRMEYYFTDGPVIVRGKTVARGKPKKVDYLLHYKDGQIPLAIVEAKDEAHTADNGLQQAMEYAEILHVPFAYSSNGHKFIEHDFLTGTEKELSLSQFPTPYELWNRFVNKNKYNEKQLQIITEPDYFDSFSSKTPRYYQHIAINTTMEKIAEGRNRLLLVMATGTGKTYTAFQIVWKLIKTGVAHRVLYLADRNILIDQTMQQDFKPFEKTMTKIQGKRMDSAYEVYMSLYQQMAGDEGNEPFREFRPEFFDIIIIDECHRGSAKEESQWRRILDYFSGAIQIGMTATPKADENVNNYTYFGEPIYTYSLKQGIDDGFLAPYKVIRISLDRDVEGWRPYKGQLDLNGNVIDDKEYNVTDFDKKLVIDERTQAVAHCITKWLKENGRFSKTIVFCVDIDHAERMCRALRNDNQDLVVENSKYIMRITGDNDMGKAQLDYFIDANEKYPAVVTTSKLMSTGVDCKTCKLIVLDNVIRSIIEFKQIIGRGTRLNPEHGKEYFTIMDFRDSCRLFADPDFDGDPVDIIDGDPDGPLPNGPEEPTTPESPEPPEYPEPPESPDEPPYSAVKYHVNGVEVNVVNERAQYYDTDGKLITESLIDYNKRNILNQYATLDNFIQSWNNADKKKAIVEELAERGVLLDELHKESGKECIDDFDLIMHIAFDQKPLTKQERVNNVKKRGYLYKYSDVCQKVLTALLDKYMDEGIFEIEDTRVLDNSPFKEFGSPMKIADLFGGKQQYMYAMHELTQQIYAQL